VSERLDRRCASLETSRLLGWLGAQYIVAASKEREGLTMEDRPEQTRADQPPIVNCKETLDAR
jgi:hypothetical protein